jgi:RNA polymerase sigma-70 factor (ECF subfamily)
MASAGAEADSVIAAGLRMKLNTFLQNFGRARKLLADCLRAAGVDVGEFA